MPGWRAMAPADVAAVVSIAAMVHPGYPEDAAVLAERQALAPGYCLVLAGQGKILGYALAHPWAGPPPPLNRLLGALPARPAALHLHDIALLPEARGAGHGAVALGLLLAAASAAGLAAATLIAIAGKEGHWRRQGFMPLDLPAAALASYGAGAVAMCRTLRHGPPT
jgi:GNAT superfamily N-acetyltransferase